MIQEREERTLLVLRMQTPFKTYRVGIDTQALIVEEACRY